MAVHVSPGGQDQSGGIRGLLPGPCSPFSSCDLEEPIFPCTVLLCGGPQKCPVRETWSPVGHCVGLPTGTPATSMKPWVEMVPDRVTSVSSGTFSTAHKAVHLRRGGRGETADSLDFRWCSWHLSSHSIISAQRLGLNGSVSTWCPHKGSGSPAQHRSAGQSRWAQPWEDRGQAGGRWMETHSLRVNRPTPTLPGQPGNPTNVCVKWPASSSSPPSPHTPHVLVVVFKPAGKVRGWW